MTTIECEVPLRGTTSHLLLNDDDAVPALPGTTRQDAHPAAAVRMLLRRSLGILRDYYGDGRNRVRLAATAVSLIYAGGAAMFWLHAIYRGEQGPAIAHSWHWLMDSTLGLVGLGPVLLVLLPVARQVTRRRDRAEPLVVGVLFGLATTPGPVLHNLIAGKDTPLARAATSVVGTDPSVAASHAHVVEHSMVSEAFLQLAIGLPVYVVLASVVWWALRRRPAPSSRAPHLARTTSTTRRAQTATG